MVLKLDQKSKMEELLTNESLFKQKLRSLLEKEWGTNLFYNTDKNQLTFTDEGFDIFYLANMDVIDAKGFNDETFQVIYQQALKSLKQYYEDSIKEPFDVTQIFSHKATIKDFTDFDILRLCMNGRSLERHKKDIKAYDLLNALATNHKTKYLASVLEENVSLLFNWDNKNLIDNNRFHDWKDKVSFENGTNTNQTIPSAHKIAKKTRALLKKDILSKLANPFDQLDLLLEVSLYLNCCEQITAIDYSLIQAYLEKVCQLDRIDFIQFVGYLWETYYPGNDSMKSHLKTDTMSYKLYDQRNFNNIDLKWINSLRGMKLHFDDACNFQDDIEKSRLKALQGLYTSQLPKLFKITFSEQMVELLKQERQRYLDETTANMKKASLNPKGVSDHMKKIQQLNALIDLIYTA